ncbi:MAG: UDP-N-acetylglucosamine 1-carboxyvinyltransferase [bacterium]|nr:UDP-N-acetylglucosamine 1-carboxyvinyltransferase [bacterium]MDD3804825.1 UDP-N-acetylglucosamine 1-carboxyvinyltransferase [bacterium]MDD4558904.1 UDP-N-acetylglucosamine 1-carboxyvinyltransferase [bacterium]
MEKIIIGGGNRLCGEVLISGAKNAALPIMAASLLASTTSTLNNIPRLTDISTMIDVLNEFSVKVITTGNRLVVSPENFALSLVPYELMKKMRASVLVVGPLLARFGSAKVSLPGGCAIGSRPIDLHIKGFQALGAEVSMEHGYIHVWADKLYGGRIYLDIPSVGATENIMMAASLADGRTIIENVAEEPEIVDLANFLNSMGACIKGAGTNIIEIEGVESLHGVEYTIIPDRIEAGTYAVVAAISKGEVRIRHINLDHLKPIITKLKDAGIHIEEMENGVLVAVRNGLNAVDVKTLPYPGFPTDMQAPLMALMSLADGISVFTETIFENRFMHVSEMKRMGADIRVEGHSAIVRGVERLTGAQVTAPDLRAGVALILAGLAAEGVTEITGIEHIDRGYEDIESKLTGLGAIISRSA